MPAGRRIAVVGAGVGGLATAVRLAASGCRVTVCEQDAQPGGKMNQVRAAGFTFDTGPSLITMPGVFHDTFRAVGRRIGDYLQLQPLDPICRYAWPDGTRLDTSSNLAAMTAAIGRLEPRDVGGFLAFLAHSRRLYERAARPFLYGERPRPRDLLARRGLDVLRIDALPTMDQVVRRYFRDPHLVQLFNRYATYNGSSPYRAPGTLCLIPSVEFVGGAWYIPGGLYRLVESLVAVCGELGVDLRLGTPVAEVLVSGRGRTAQATGMRLASGETLAADAVVVNSDPLRARDALFAADRREAAAGRPVPPNADLSCSGFVLLLGTDCRWPMLAHHNIFFSADYPAEFRAIFDARRPAPDPTIYVTYTSASDPTQAPPGGGNLFVLVNAPPDADPAHWAAWAEPYAERVLDRLEASGLAGLRRHLVYRQVITPADFARRYSAYGGALYGYASHSRGAAFARPANRAPGVRRLYFVGGSAHPGGGVPLVLLGARLVAGLVRGDL
ncbi:MAG TPA: phytoene desaturase family protein [Chloroflexia bacterium]|nr:phytoene desaturase family protein [Chloroflexia bacterium]